MPLENVKDCNEYEKADKPRFSITLCPSCVTKGDHGGGKLGRILDTQMGDCEGDNCIHYRECRACDGYGRHSDTRTCSYCRGEGRILVRAEE